MENNQTQRYPVFQAPFPYSQFPAQPSLGYGAVPAQSPVSYAAPQPPVGYGAVPAGDAVQPVAQDAAPVSYWDQPPGKAMNL